MLAGTKIMKRILKCGRFIGKCTKLDLLILVMDPLRLSKDEEKVTLTIPFKLLFNVTVKNRWTILVKVTHLLLA